MSFPNHIHSLTVRTIHTESRVHKRDKIIPKKIIVCLDQTISSVIQIIVRFCVLLSFVVCALLCSYLIFSAQSPWRSSLDELFHCSHVLQLVSLPKPSSFEMIQIYVLILASHVSQGCAPEAVFINIQNLTSKKYMYIFFFTLTTRSQEDKMRVFHFVVLLSFIVCMCMIHACLQTQPSCAYSRLFLLSYQKCHF